MTLNKRLVLIVILAAVLAASCSSGTPTPAPLPTRPPALFIDVLEMQFSQPGTPLPDGPFEDLAGVYTTTGANENALLLCQLSRASVQCSSHPVTLDGIQPGLVRVSGQAAGGNLGITQAEPLAVDEAAMAAAVQAKFAAIAEELARYDWSTIAMQEFEESSAWFHPEVERLMTIPFELYAYDSANDLLIWRGQGWEMPKQTRTVYRFPVFYIAIDPAGELPAEAFVTIEGYVEE
jgi:hypothetical protein